MVEIISSLIGNDFWATLVMSLVPLIELKGSIVFARGVGMDFLQALALAYVGSTIVFIPIYFLLKPILKLLKKVKFISRLAEKAESYCVEKANSALEGQKAKGKSSSMSETLLKQLGVFVFVAIPLPMTGIWTGTAIAVFLNLKFKDAVLPIVLGNLIAGLLISGLAALCMAIWSIEVLDYILYALFAIAVVLLVVLIIKVARQKPNNEIENKVE
ncbi:MAG: small multi-drug export protein [Clostridia bacterium]|nr:small multi-drug export protein [Clostridia bacterium]